MKYVKTFEQFINDGVNENATLKQAAAEVGAEMLKKKLTEAAKEIVKHAMEIDSDDSDLTANDALKEAMFENAAILKQVATDIAIDKAKEKMSESKKYSKVNENPALAAMAAQELMKKENAAVAMMAKDMMKEMYENFKAGMEKQISEMDLTKDTRTKIGNAVGIPGEAG